MTQPADATTVPGRGALLIGLLAGVVCVAFEAVAVATAMPEAARELGQLGLYAWAFTLFVLGMVFSTAVTGRLCDRIGPAKPLAAGTALFALGLLLAGAAPSMTVLVGARFLQGIGGGAMNLCLMVVVAQAFAEAERARIMTWFSVCWVMPAFLGPPLSAAITHQFGWHWVFWSLVPALVVAALLAGRPLARLQRDWRPHPVEPDPVPLWAAALAAVGAALLQAAGQLMDWRGALFAVAAVAALLVAVPRIMPPGFLRLRPGLPAVVWSRGAQSGAFMAAEAFLPLSLVHQRGLSLFHAGLALTIGSLGWTLGSWLQSSSRLRMRRDRIIVLGVCLTLVGIALLSLSAFWGHRLLALTAIGWTLSGLGMGLGIASQSLAVMVLAPAGQLGRSTSSLQTADSLGNSLAGGLAGTVFLAAHQSNAAFGPIFAATALLAALGLVVSLRVGPVRQDAAADAGANDPAVSEGHAKMEG